MSEEGGLSKAEKAALVVLYLERDAATAVLRELDDAELRALKAASSRIKEPKIAEVQAAVAEFMGELNRPVALKASGDAYVDGLMSEAIGANRMKRVFDASTGPGSRLLEKVDPKISASLLEREHPQAVAALLYSLDDGAAARILKAMPEARTPDIVRRIAALSAVNDDAVAKLEASFAQSIGEGGGSQKKRLNGVSKAASLLNNLEPEAAKKVIEGVADKDKTLADKIKSARFTIDDLAAADARGIQQVLREVESDKLLYAMKTVSEAVREKFLACVSSRVAESLREELKNLGPVRIKDVESAQKVIVDVALRLQGEGKLALASRGGEDFV